MKDRGKRKHSNQIPGLQITAKLINSFFHSFLSGQLSSLFLGCLFLMLAIIFLSVGFQNENEQMSKLSIVFQR